VPEEDSANRSGVVRYVVVIAGIVAVGAAFLVLAVQRDRDEGRPNSVFTCNPPAGLK
jgi:hypothetical protein